MLLHCIKVNVIRFEHSVIGPLIADTCFILMFVSSEKTRLQLFPLCQHWSQCCWLIHHNTGRELLFWVLFYYNICDMCNYMSTDLLPQVVVKSGPVHWPGVIPLDSRPGVLLLLSSVTKTHSCSKPLLIQVQDLCTCTSVSHTRTQISISNNITRVLLTYHFILFSLFTTSCPLQCCPLHSCVCVCGLIGY